MKAYAIAHVRQVTPHPDLGEYMRRIDATLEPYGGRFRVHNATHEVVEGTWDGGIIMIGFPSMDAAREWYKSDAYQDILALRTRHMEIDIILVEGIEEPYSAAETAAKLGF